MNVIVYRTSSIEIPLHDQVNNIVELKFENGDSVEAPESSTSEHEFYLTYKPVIKESAEKDENPDSNPDASARESQSTPCLHRGQPLQPLLHNVFVGEKSF